MLYYLTAIGLIAHAYFWGIGAACLVLPRLWRRWAWVFAPGFGFALQSAVVWAGVHTSWEGTNAYAKWGELIPAALLTLTIIRGPSSIALKNYGICLVMVITGWLLISPMTEPGRGLTTSSLGNCDQADYAAGARVFQEFSRDDRSGFMGLPEVTKVRSADYFFDFWVRLNHFTPSALIAYNATIFGVPSFRLVSVMTAVVLLLNLPIVFFLARLAVGIRGVWLIGFIVLYAVSPLNAYAVYHGQLGQLYATQGIAMLTLAVFGATQMIQVGRSAWPFWPLLFASFWVLAGSYNFILPICLVPAAALLGAQLFQRKNWKAVQKVLTIIASALLGCALLFWGRFDGIVERFSLFRQYNFGWVVPLFSPEGLAGIVKDAALNPWPTFIRIFSSTAVLSGWFLGLAVLWRTQRRHAIAVLSLTLPVIVGWSILAWEARTRANASYDAYKLVSVFLPGLLAGLVCWLAAVYRCRYRVQIGTGLVLLLLLVANVSADEKFRTQMSQPPLRVNRNIAELSQIEKDLEINSINMMMESPWSRLWANVFLLKKPQYFPVHTYEGRLNTPLRGEWNLSDSLLHAVPLQPANFKQFNVRYQLVRANAEGLLQVSFSSGWYAEENSGPKRWRWSDGTGQILVNNAGVHPVRAQLRLLVQSFLPRDITVQVGSQVPVRKSLDGSSQLIECGSMLFYPGSSVLKLTGEALSPGGNDDRKLAFALYGLELQTTAIEP